MSMTNNSNTPQKWIVGIQEHCQAPGRTIGTIVKMNDPGTGDIRDYAIMSSIDGTDSYIAEFQSMTESFSTFIVGRHIIKDGDIYLINRIDPLLFYLATQSIDEQKQGGIRDRNKGLQPKKHSWQPYDQLLEQSKLPILISKFISEAQIQHVCLTFGNGELYFKFDVDKTLHWLQKKQERVLESLIGQDQRRQKVNEKNSIAGKKDDQSGGSISANFNFGKPGPVVALVEENSKTASQSDINALKIESFQIVCNYLNETWSKKFIEHLGYTSEQIMSSTKTKRKSSVVSNASDTGDIDNVKEDNIKEFPTTKTDPNQKTMVAARTVGNKRLVKLNTKGMRSIGSFFTTGKAKKAKR